MKTKSLRWLHGEAKSPPMSKSARREIGYLLRELQDGESLAMPHSRPMPTVGARCHELRVNDENKTWRLVYRIDANAIVIVEVFEKKSAKTPAAIVRSCRRRLRAYEGSLS